MHQIKKQPDSLLGLNITTREVCIYNVELSRHEHGPSIAANLVWVIMRGTCMDVMSVNRQGYIQETTTPRGSWMWVAWLTGMDKVIR